MMEQWNSRCALRCGSVIKIFEKIHTCIHSLIQYHTFGSLIFEFDPVCDRFSSNTVTGSWDFKIDSVVGVTSIDTFLE